MDLKEFAINISLSVLFTIIIIIIAIGLSWIIELVISPHDINVNKEVPQKYIILECREGNNYEIN